MFVSALAPEKRALPGKQPSRAAKPNRGSRPSHFEEISAATRRERSLLAAARVFSCVFIFFSLLVFVKVIFFFFSVEEIAKFLK